MAESVRPSTPPRSSAPLRADLTPEQVRRIEENRLKAKAIRDQHEAAARASGHTPSLNRTPSGFIVAGQKRPYASLSTVKDTPINQRDARRGSSTNSGGAPPSKTVPPGDANIQAAQKFQKYVEYDFSKMVDTKGGFLTAEDDPHNRALHSNKPEDERPAHMTLKEWERHRLLKSLREQRAGPFEPGLSSLKDKADGSTKQCRECGSLEIDWKWEEVFACCVCQACKDKHPEKYSLLTKTEAKEDYLLTDPELRDPELLPHLERPNPHKSTWNNMMLYLRYQVEEYALSDKKWGSGEALDEEFAKREGEKKRRKEEKFKSKLLELKKRTRVEAYKRGRKGGGGGNFGDAVGGGGKHEHEWGRPVEDPETGVSVRRCVDCGMEVEELEF